MLAGETPAQAIARHEASATRWDELAAENPGTDRFTRYAADSRAQAAHIRQTLETRA